MAVVFVLGSTRRATSPCRENKSTSSDSSTLNGKFLTSIAVFDRCFGFVATVNDATLTPAAVSAFFV
eukprot:CAMPEP_0177701110 /NCGR_PEP_ID=MMETSP0484_2-20121128/6445_1 /TAXON_ID=354590 /ORGANISM="Rhodomonas lens, Strain RHODO" /LENGTH=66 /DNA_ID=CAMNT_0019212339 /DNA_START=168 /DNA_END=368 /DNA_ORIENTATION=-